MSAPAAPGRGKSGAAPPRGTRPAAPDRGKLPAAPDRGKLPSAPDRGKLDARRARILAAARTVFAQEGGLSAGLRAIAAEAGVTTGAIYGAFSGKEDIYAALQEQALREVARETRAAAEAETGPAEALAAAARAFWAWYAARPFEQSLGFYLFERDGRRGLGPERDRALNARLEDSLSVFSARFEALGAAPARARALSLSLFAGLAGAASIAIARRDRSLRAEAETIVDTLIGVHVTALQK